MKSPILSSLTVILGVTALSAASNAPLQSSTSAVVTGKSPVVVQGPVSEKAPASYVFRYTGFNEQGAMIVTGRLSVSVGPQSPRSSRPARGPSDSDNTKAVRGSWSLGRMGNPKDIGPQLGAGQLAGSMRGLDLVINLNPNVADDNVYLQGDLSTGKYTGTWYYSTFAGARAQGKFVAEMGSH